MVAIGEEDAVHSQWDTEVDHPPRIGISPTVSTTHLVVYRESTAIICQAGCIMSPWVRVDTALGGRQLGRHMAHLVGVS